MVVSLIAILSLCRQLFFIFEVLTAIAFEHSALQSPCDSVLTAAAALIVQMCSSATLQVEKLQIISHFQKNVCLEGLVRCCNGVPTHVFVCHVWFHYG